MLLETASAILPGLPSRIHPEIPWGIFLVILFQKLLQKFFRQIFWKLHRKFFCIFYRSMFHRELLKFLQELLCELARSFYENPPSGSSGDSSEYFSRNRTKSSTGNSRKLFREIFSKFLRELSLQFLAEFFWIYLQKLLWEILPGFIRKFFSENLRRNSLGKLLGVPRRFLLDFFL